MEPSNDRVERHCEQEAARGAALPDTGHEELTSGFPCKLNLRGGAAINRPQESTNESWLFRIIEDVEDPGVIDARICRSKVRQHNTRITCSLDEMHL